MKLFRIPDKRVAVLLSSVLAFGLIEPRPALAIFGLDFDPVQAGHAVQQIAQAEHQIEQLEAIINTARQNVAIIEHNVMALVQKQTYMNVLNNTLHAQGANASTYTAATLPLNSANTPTTRDQLASLANIQLADSTSQNTVGLLNQIASLQNSNRSPVGQWQSSVYSHEPSLNTGAAQQNLTNIGLVQLYEQNQQQIAISGALAQQTALQNMRARNQEVSAINFWQRMSGSAREPYAIGGMAEDLRTHSLF